MSNYDSLRNTPVSELLSPVKTVSPSDSVSKVIGFLRDNDFHEAFVEEEERTAIVTIRDILNVKDITTTKIAGIMAYIPRLTPSSTIAEAAALMFEHRIRSLPVYKNSALKGQITAQAIVERLMTFDLDGKIGNIMTASPITVSRGDPAAKAKSIMLRRKIDQLPILEDGHELSGVITSATMVYNMLPETDRGRKGGWRGGKGQGKRMSLSVDDFAEADTTTNDVSDSPRKVYDTMARMRTNYSIIQNYDEVQGIVTYRDFARLLVEPERQTQGRPMYIVGLPEDPFEAEAAREKFTRITKHFERMVPNMSESRAIIKKTKAKGAARTRYEVQVFVKSPLRQYSYHASGFELPDVFDTIDRWSKSVVGRSTDKRRRRVRADPGAIESATMT